jgi:hypothetical protein
VSRRANVNSITNRGSFFHSQPPAFFVMPENATIGCFTPALRASGEPWRALTSGGSRALAPIDWPISDQIPDAPQIVWRFAFGEGARKRAVEAAREADRAEAQHGRPAWRAKVGLRSGRQRSGNARMAVCLGSR